MELGGFGVLLRAGRFSFGSMGLFVVPGVLESGQRVWSFVPRAKWPCLGDMVPAWGVRNSRSSQAVSMRDLPDQKHRQRSSLERHITQETMKSDTTKVVGQTGPQIEFRILRKFGATRAAGKATPLPFADAVSPRKP